MFLYNQPYYPIMLQKIQHYHLTIYFLHHNLIINNPFDIFLLITPINNRLTYFCTLA